MGTFLADQLTLSQPGADYAHYAQWVRRVQKRNFGSWISPDFVVLVNSLGFK